jgi:hypothetical protein
MTTIEEGATAKGTKIKKRAAVSLQVACATYDAIINAMMIGSKIGGRARRQSHLSWRMAVNELQRQKPRREI